MARFYPLLKQYAPAFFEPTCRILEEYVLEPLLIGGSVRIRPRMLGTTGSLLERITGAIDVGQQAEITRR